MEGIVLAPPGTSIRISRNSGNFTGNGARGSNLTDSASCDVALTRAKRATYVILPYREDKGRRDGRFHVESGPFLYPVPQPGNGRHTSGIRSVMPVLPRS